jgi:hypothetical protein
MRPEYFIQAWQGLRIYSKIKTKVSWNIVNKSKAKQSLWGSVF